MSLEPFDYLTYKRNKSLSAGNSGGGTSKQSRPKNYASLGDEPSYNKIIAGVICIVTFATIFAFFMYFIGSKSSKVDIEYGRLGKEAENLYSDAGSANDEEGETTKTEKFTIDKRLFLIRQEEKGPSEARIVGQTNKEQAEVISKEQFERIKNNEFIKKKQEEVPDGADETNSNAEEEAKSAQNAQSTAIKPVIKPKIAPKPTSQPSAAKPASSLEPASVHSKVLIGKYTTQEEAQAMQAKVSEVVQGGTPYVKKVGIYYSVQIGAYENFDKAKSIAGKLQSRGFEAWIMQ